MNKQHILGKEKGSLQIKASICMLTATTATITITAITTITDNATVVVVLILY